MQALRQLRCSTCVLPDFTRTVTRSSAGIEALSVSMDCVYCFVCCRCIWASSLPSIPVMPFYYLLRVIASRPRKTLATPAHAHIPQLQILIPIPPCRRALPPLGPYRPLLSNPRVESPVATPRAPRPSRAVPQREVVPADAQPGEARAEQRARDDVEALVLVVGPAAGTDVEGCYDGGGD